jgi:signal transduction histidine kinase
VTFDPEAGSTASPAPAVLAIVIAPSFSQTIWFRMLVGLLAVGLISMVLLVLHRRRVQSIEAQHSAILAERNRIAHDLHDTLAQGFTGISVQLEAATGWMADDPTRARSNIDKARALVRTSLADARRAVWDLKPEAIDSGNLVTALSEIARSLSGNVAIRIQVNGKPRTVPPDVQKGVLRIGQEALTNAVKHAQAENIALTVSFLDNDVVLQVTDNGKGFDPVTDKAGPGHLGLEGIHKRAKLIGATVEIKSKPGGGTEITLTAPTMG